MAYALTIWRISVIAAAPVAYVFSSRSVTIAFSGNNSVCIFMAPIICNVYRQQCRIAVAFYAVCINILIANAIVASRSRINKLALT